MIIFVAFFIHIGIHFASILHTLLCLKLAPHTTVCQSSKIIRMGGGGDSPEALQYHIRRPLACKGAERVRLQANILPDPARAEGSPHTPRRPRPPAFPNRGLIDV